MNRRPITEETRQKLRASAIARGIMPPSRKGARHTVETRMKMSKSKTKHGKTSLRQIIRNSFEMRQWRNDVFKRDDYTCTLCGSRSKKGNIIYIEADHYPKSFASLFNEYGFSSLLDAINCAELWDTNNGRTLCKACHLEVTHTK